ncbi:MAG: DUF2314 domain-containing protein [Acidobacteria bacterium]|nr:DUF2314 domain-containing protein [Acidobacteriota bacterium]
MPEDSDKEFARAFAEGAGENFAAKARFATGDDGSEHIWIDVESLDSGIVRRSLGNDPVNLEGFAAGSPVQVETAAIEDWAFLRNGEPQGLFSVPVLMAMQAERTGEASSLIH